MTAPLDVLAVMDLAARTVSALDCGDSKEQRLESMREARAAVAELVEAADTLATLCDAGEYDLDHDNIALAVERVQAALAKFGGAV